MKIERHLLSGDDDSEKTRLDLISIEDFANKHDLVMIVTERELFPRNSNMRFYAHFKGTEVKTGNILGSEHGNGITEEDAIRDYAKRISNKLLILNAFKPTRKSITAPSLSYIPPKTT